MNEDELDKYGGPDEPEDVETTANLRPIDDYDWLPELEAKIWEKHKLRPEDIEACFSDPDPKGKVREAGKGKYILLSHSSHGRYLFIVFAYKTVDNRRIARIISARPMGKKELQLYRRK